MSSEGQDQHPHFTDEETEAETLWLSYYHSSRACEASISALNLHAMTPHG